MEPGISEIRPLPPEPGPKIEGLHLQDLQIRGFRGINALHIPRLGRITLLVGGNGVGKTTVLEAVDTYAARGRHPDLGAFLARRGEFIDQQDEGEGGSVRVFDYAALFHGRDVDGNPTISIGPTEDEEWLEIRALPSKDWSREYWARLGPRPKRAPENLVDLQPDALEVSFRGDRRILLNTPTAASKLGSWRLTPELREPPAIECLFRQPGLPSNDALVSLWDRIALTEAEGIPLRALRLTLRESDWPDGPDEPLEKASWTRDFTDDVEGVTAIGDHHQSRRLFVKLKEQQRAPLASLGDGALRAFGTMLALVNSRDGFLLIDEADNGIDESLYDDYWGLMLQAARKYNVQVIATTHSLACTKGFARAVRLYDTKDDSIIVRLMRGYEGEVRAHEYRGWELEEFLHDIDREFID